MKERVRNVLECEGEKENKRRGWGGGGDRDRLDTCVEEKNKKKEKKKWKRMDENELKERKNNIKKFLIEKFYHNIFTINFK